MADVRPSKLQPWPVASSLARLPRIHWQSPASLQDDLVAYKPRPLAELMLRCSIFSSVGDRAPYSSIMEQWIGTSIFLKKIFWHKYLLALELPVLAALLGLQQLLLHGYTWPVHSAVRVGHRARHGDECLSKREWCRARRLTLE